MKNISQKTSFIFWIFAISRPSFATHSANNIIVLLLIEDYKKEDVGTSSKDNAKIFFALFEKRLDLIITRNYTIYQKACRDVQRATT